MTGNGRGKLGNPDYDLLSWFGFYCFFLSFLQSTPAVVRAAQLLETDKAPVGWLNVQGKGNGKCGYTHPSTKLFMNKRKKESECVLIFASWMQIVDEVLRRTKKITFSHAQIYTDKHLMRLALWVLTHLSVDKAVRERKSEGQEMLKKSIFIGALRMEKRKLRRGMK